MSAIPTNPERPLRAEDFPCITHRDDLIRLISAVEHLTSEMETLSSEIHDIRKNGLAPLITEVAVQKVKLDRISWIVYGCAAGLAAQGATIVTGIVLWFVTTQLT